jgi:hypothetical protein
MTTIDILKALPNPFIAGLHLPPKQQQVTARDVQAIVDRIAAKPVAKRAAHKAARGKRKR